MEKQQDIKAYFSSRKKQPTIAGQTAKKLIEGSPSPSQLLSDRSTGKSTRLQPSRAKSAIKNAGTASKKVLVLEKASAKTSSDKKIATASAKPIQNSAPRLPVNPPVKPKTMTLVEFQKQRELLGGAAIKDFRTKCDNLQRTPEKLVQSPFYSPHKSHLTTAQVSANIRNQSVRRQLFGETSTPSLEDDMYTSSGSIPSTAKELVEKSTGSSLNEQDSGLIVLPPITAPSPILKTPQKGSRNNEANLLSPGKKMSLFSPQKGHVYSYVKTAADVHAEAVCKDVPGANDPKDARMRELYDKEGSSKRKADFDRENVKKRLELFKSDYTTVKASAQTRNGLLHGLAASGGNAPAFERYADLIKPRPEEVGPLLPRKYLDLQDVFQRVDMGLTVCSNRSGACCFEKLRSALLVGRKEPLSYTELSHIMGIFSEGFVIRVHKATCETDCPDWKINQRSGVCEHYMLFVRDDQKPMDPSEELLLSAKLTPLDRVRRQKKFRQILLNHLLAQHREFLANLEPPQILDDQTKVTHWHSLFPIEEIELPEPAKLQEFSKPVAARTFEQVLKMAGEMGTGVRRPLFQKSTEKETGTSVRSPRKPVVDEKIFDHPAFKHMDEETKKRVRAAEARKQMHCVVKDPKIAKRRQMLERMVDMGRILLGHFSSPIRKVLPEEEVLQTMKRSMGNAVTMDELQQHYDLFIEIFVAAKWLYRIRCDGTVYVRKIDDNFGIVQMEATVEEEEKRLDSLIS